MPQAISDLAMLGDCNGAAMADRDGAIVWWCAPRFDSRPAFCRMLDPEGGHFRIGPTAPAGVRRAYRPDTLVLETTFATATGTLRVTDCLPFASGARGDDIGHGAPHAIVRLAEVLAGEVEVELDFAPRLDFRLAIPALDVVDGAIRTTGGPDTLQLVVDGVDVAVDGDRATGRATLRQGASVAAVLQHREGWERTDFATIDARVALFDTSAAWASWVAGRVAYSGSYAEEVAFSARVLRALTYVPTGAIVASPTCSLPEVPGGPANWDYRFAWLRDASLTVRALDVAASPAQANRWLHWLTSVGLATRHDGLPPVVLGVCGERDLGEHELDHLEGFGGARPVRRGNAAWTQRQLDIPGEILDAAWCLRDNLGELAPRERRLLTDLAEAVMENWREDDSGIWEGREGERPYTHSKVMCWVALDRAIRLADRLGAEDRVVQWRATAEEIRAKVLDEGFDEGVGAYTGAFGSDHLDSAVLHWPIVGFLPADDERMAATIAAIERDLSPDGLPRRWTGGEDEGAFAIVAFWLAECHARAGNTMRARELVDRVLADANDVGLIAEALVGEGGLLGNHPHTFSHVGLIQAARAIDQAEQGAAP